MGMVTQGSLISNLIARKVKRDSPVERVLYKQFKQIYLHTTLGKLSRILDTEYFALVVHEQKQCESAGLPRKNLIQKLLFDSCVNFLVTGRESATNKQVIVGIVTRMDLLNYVANHGPISPN